MTNEITTKKLNCRPLIEDLRVKGYSIYKISACIGKNTNTVQSWMKGHEPSYSAGAALIKFHTQICGEERTKNRLEELVYSPT